MMTDGVLDALPAAGGGDHERDHYGYPGKTPKEMSRGNSGTGTRIQRLSCEG